LRGWTPAIGSERMGRARVLAPHLLSDESGAILNPKRHCPDGASTARVTEVSEMAAQLNHLIIPAHDKWKSARFLAGILGLEVGPEWGPFLPVRTSNA